MLSRAYGIESQAINAINVDDVNSTKNTHAHTQGIHTTQERNAD